MPYLEVPGANLFYETVGVGQVLLCITGANGSLEFFQPLAEQLKSLFTVVMYDRTFYQLPVEAQALSLTSIKRSRFLSQPFDRSPGLRPPHRD